MQLLLLLILGALACVMLYQLYAVLGRRVGRQPQDGLRSVGLRIATEGELQARVAEPVQPQGVAAIREREASFDLAKFLDGARTSYETIVRAFAAGDRGGLEKLVSPEVFTVFSQVISEREAEGRSEVVEFLHPARADLDHADMEGDVARVRVRFLAELRSRAKGPEGEGVDDRRTAELWTFERNFSGADSTWLLVRVDAAEA